LTSDHSPYIFAELAPDKPDAAHNFLIDEGDFFPALSGHD